MDIIKEVDKQAHDNTKYHCLYGFYFLNFSKQYLAKIYKKDVSTISRWIIKFEKDGGIKRKVREQVFSKFDEVQRDWLLNLYKIKPILQLQEARQEFFKKFSVTISPSTISLILRDAGFTWKCIERRAIQFQMDDLLRYTEDLNRFPWFLNNLVFIDEVNCDNRCILRKNGYSIKGTKLLYRGEFVRKPRRSLLCFLGIKGIINSYDTEGTFNRKKFTDYCKQFALDSQNQVEMYPGTYSIWILDGARIHCDTYFISFLRSLGIIPLFLPAYSPFLNPIEIVFGLFKRELKQIYVENSKKNFDLQIAEVLNSFYGRDMTAIFKKCGYVSNGRFDPSVVSMENLDNAGYGGKVNE